MGTHDAFTKMCFSKRELKDPVIKRVKAEFIFEIILRFAENQEDEVDVE